MNRIVEKFVSEFEIQKSKFISLLYPLNDKNEVKDILNSVRKDYPKATHYCYAYVFDSTGKSNDDGEPAKTAGRPILEVLLKNEINRCLLVVVRYFGGIKLGAGGLTRAYIQAAVDVVNKADLYHDEVRKIYQLKVDYPYIDSVNSYLKTNNIEIEKIDYDDKVYYEISCENLDFDDINDYLQGKVTIAMLNERLVLVKNK